MRRNDILRKERKMGFVNGFLTDKEIDRFRELNIFYGKKIYIVDQKSIGVHKNRIYDGVRCTVNREKSMYFFCKGIDSDFAREKMWSPYFFVMIIFEEENIIIIRIELEDVLDKPEGVYRQWKKIDITGTDYKTKKEIKNIERYFGDIKEAVRVFGYHGRIDEGENHNVLFDF